MAAGSITTASSTQIPPTAQVALAAVQSGFDVKNPQVS
jgi:hypothetical protein